MSKVKEAIARIAKGTSYEKEPKDQSQQQENTHAHPSRPAGYKVNFELLERIKAARAEKQQLSTL